MNSIGDDEGNLALGVEMGEKYLASSASPDDHPDLAAFYSCLANLYSAQHYYDKACALFHKAIDMIVQTEGESALVLTSMYSSLAVTYRKLGEMEKAIEFNNKSIAIHVLNGTENCSSCGSAYNNIAIVYKNQNKLSEAIVAFENSLKIMLIDLDPSHPHVQSTLISIASTHQDIMFSEIIAWVSANQQFSNNNQAHDDESDQRIKLIHDSANSALAYFSQSINPDQTDEPIKQIKGMMAAFALRQSQFDDLRKSARENGTNFGTSSTSASALKEPTSMTIKEMKMELTSAGRTSEIARCSEKSDLITLLQSHREENAFKAARTSDVQDNDVEKNNDNGDDDDDDDDNDAELQAALAMSMQQNSDASDTGNLRSSSNLNAERSDREDDVLELSSDGTFDASFLPNVIPFRAPPDSFTGNFQRAQEAKTVLVNGAEKLRQASQRGDLAKATELINSGVNVNCVGLVGDTPLHWACQHGHGKIATALLDNDADIDPKDHGSFTPLYLSCSAGHAEVAAILLERGANVSSRTIGGSTPLHIACERNHEKVAAVLIKFGAIVSAVNHDGKSSLELCKTESLRNIVLDKISVDTATLEEMVAEQLTEEHEGDFEMRGVKLEVLQALVSLAKRKGGSWSVGRMSACILGNHEILKEGHRWDADLVPADTLTFADKMSLIDLLQTHHKDANSPPHPDLGVRYDDVVGEKATKFVSFAYVSDFFDIVQSIETYVVENPEAADDYFWVDMLVNNQWFALDHDFAWWSSTFKKAVGEIGHMLLMCTPWSDPEPLKRAWCLWEIFCVHITNSKLTILLGAAQEQSFFSTLRSESHSTLMDNFCKLDVEKATCYLASDRDSIFEAINANGGAAGINNSISAMMRDWFEKQAERLVWDEDISSVGLDTIPDDELLQSVRPFENLCTAGRVYEELMKYDKAILYYEQAVEGYKEVFGLYHAQTLCWMHKLSNVYQHEDRGKEAKALLLEVSNAYSFMEPGNEESRNLKAEILMTMRMNEAANVSNEGRFGEAVKLFQGIIDEVGIDHPAIGSNSAFFFNLGAAYSAQGKLEMGLEWMEKGIKLIRPEDSDLPQNVQMLSNISGIHYQHGNVEKAISISKVVLAKHLKVFGEDNIHTLMGAYNLGYIMFKSLDYEGALPHLELVEKILNNNKKLEDSDPARMGLFNLARLLVDIGRDYRRASEVYLRCIHITEQKSGPKDMGVIDACYQLGMLYKDHLNNNEAARPYLIRAADAFRARYGQKHLNTLAAVGALSQCSPKVSVDNATAHCGYCGQLGPRQRCTRCLDVSYCCREHQKLDFQTHKLVCKPQKVPPTAAPASTQSHTGPSVSGSTTVLKDPSSMTIKEMKIELTSAGLTSEFTKCSEKTDVVALLHAFRQGKVKKVEVVEAAEEILSQQDKNALLKEMSESMNELNRMMVLRQVSPRGILSGQSPPTNAETDEFTKKLKIFYWDFLPKFLKHFEDHPQNPENFGLLANMFDCTDASKDFVESLFRKALATKTKVLGAQAYSTLQTANQMGNILMLTGKVDEARQLYERAYCGFLKLVGPDDYLTKSARMGVEMLNGNLSNFESPIFSEFTEALGSQVLEPNAENREVLERINKAGANQSSYSEFKLQQMAEKVAVLNKKGYTDVKAVELALGNSRGDIDKAIELLENSGGKVK